MNNGNIKTLATIAMILQGLNVALGIVIVVLQRTLVSALMVKTLDLSRKMPGNQGSHGSSALSTTVWTPKAGLSSPRIFGTSSARRSA